MNQRKSKLSKCQNILLLLSLKKTTLQTDSYKDLLVVRRYVDEITEFIDGIIHDEGRATIFACEVFIALKKWEAVRPFSSEEQRYEWLKTKAGELAANHLKTSRGKIKDKAVKQAIRAYPGR